MTTTTSTASLEDALHDLARADLDTDTGHAHALNALDYLDREIDRIRTYITARGEQS
jgi:hypothetical protein